jgi:hypothetical protein
MASVPASDLVDPVFEQRVGIGVTFVEVMAWLLLLDRV